ncbi:MAG: hypothetical protein WC397_01855 [Candidatus Paceibacterota bacterium]|jgi:hypothetical protein
MGSLEKPTILLSIIFFAGFMAVSFYLLVPAFNNDYQVQRAAKEAKIKQLENLKEYHQKVAVAYDELKKINWEAIEDKMDINFTASGDPTFLPKMYSYFGKAFGSTAMAVEGVSGSESRQTSPASAASAGKEGVATDEAMGAGGEFSGPVKENDFSLSLSGDYSSFKVFLAKLENQVLLAKVKSIGFSAPSVSIDKKGNTVSGTMSFSVVLSVPSY